ncbi:interferon a3-like [Symphorus nematophorus]
MFSWTVLLFVLCGVLPAPCLCCDWLKHYGHHSNKSLTLIRLMGDKLTKSQVSFPNHFYRRIQNAQVESQLVFVRDSLDLILGLYNHDNFSVPVTWDTDKKEHFLMSIYRQIDGLNKTCVTTHRPADIKLRNYYRKLGSTLARTGGSTASWEEIRWVTKLHLDRLDLLVSSIKASAEASKRRSTPRHSQH